MLLERVWQVFGPDALGHAVFYRHAPALRFELAGGETTLDRFSQAYDRARAVTARAFEKSGPVTVVLGSYVVDGKLNRRSVLQAARTCRVEVPSHRDYALQPPAVGSDTPERSLIAFEVAREVLPRLLWGALAQELGIRPRLLGDLYLADPTGGLLLHPYDDRGMDVIGNHGRLAALEQEFRPWLLAYDVDRMTGFFPASPESTCAETLILNGHGGPVRGR